MPIKGFFQKEFQEKQGKKRKRIIVQKERKKIKVKNLPNNDSDIIKKADLVFKQINEIHELDTKIQTINDLRILLHKYSPFFGEPVDCVLWMPINALQANDYNPNIVAPPEMKLLEHSIEEDGYTQPIVTWATNNHYEVIDGFHRNRVGKESTTISTRIHSHLPITVINDEREDRGDRISATIRHNRARGKHTVEGMSEIVLELKNRNWTNERIAKQLGMEEDEILRLCQITGLAGLFSDQEFSKSWDIEDSEPNFASALNNEDSDIEDSIDVDVRTVNTDDPNRIFHQHTKWECYKAGLYATTKEGMSRDECEEAYHNFLVDTKRFGKALKHITTKWKNSCEHYLTNVAMNRIAWLGQAAMCYATGVPAIYRGGFNLLSKEQQDTANETALIYLNKWLKGNGRNQVTMEEALSGKQMDLY